MIFRLIPLALLILALAACSGGDASDATRTATPPAGAVGGAGALIIARPDGLYEYAIDSGAYRPLVVPDTAGTYVLDPAVSPDFSRIAYAVQPPPDVSQSMYDAGSDLWVAARDGAGERRVFAHVEPNQLVRFPQWQDDTHVIAIIQESHTEADVTQVLYTLQRIDIDSGERTLLLDEAVAFAVSPDGSRLAYSGFADETGQTLEAIDVAGDNLAVLVAASEKISPYNSPRYSPDGASVAFAAADQTTVRAATRFVTSRPPTAPSANGLPEDIWLVDAAGGRPQRVADLKEDLPGIAWSGDGGHIYALGALGLWDINLLTGAVTRIGEGVFHAQIAWTP